jgi:hypothetical protein
MQFKFEKLIIWQKAMDFGESIFRLSYKFPFLSLAEVVTFSNKASKRNYISEEEFKEHYDYAYNLMNMMIAFKEKIK